MVCLTLQWVLTRKANSDYYMQLPVLWPKLYCWAITPKHTVLHLYQTGYSYTAKQHRYLRELRLVLYRLSNFTYSHSLFLSLSLYTRHNAILSIQTCRAHLGDALFACPGPHSLQLHNTMLKYTRKRRD